MESDKGATVLMSGGIDSAACAAFLMAQGLKVSAIYINHGQAASAYERRAANLLSTALNIQLSELFFFGSDPSGAGELIGRNAFLTFAVLFATRAKTSQIALGLHSGTPYYDCSPAFVTTINRVVAEHTDGKVQVVTPFIEWTKREVFEYFMRAGLPISSTYSCEAGSAGGCGQCASCLDRKALRC
jgi:7-cyano-7-deazaguanine synthase